MNYRDYEPQARDTKSKETAIAAAQYTKEHDYWQKQLAGQLPWSSFHYDKRDEETVVGKTSRQNTTLEESLYASLMKFSRGSDPNIHMLLTAGLVLLLSRYTGSKDIMIGMPIYRQKEEKHFTNTILPLRHKLTAEQTFKDLILNVRQTVNEAVENQAYPVEQLKERLEFGEQGGGALFDVAILLQNIHDRNYIQGQEPGLVFSFNRTDRTVDLELEFDEARYNKITVERIIAHYVQLMNNALADLDNRLHHIEMLTGEEKEQLLNRFNDSAREYQLDKTIHQAIEEQVLKTPDEIAVIGTDHENRAVTYRELNRRSEQLARQLNKAGVKEGTVAAIMMEPSLEMIAALIGIMKAGAAYQPIEPTLPPERVSYMLKDSAAAVVLTDSNVTERISFTQLQGIDENNKVSIKRTAPRPHIKEFDQLPIPNRYHIDLNNYKGKIGMASVTNSISIQTTRGCPYECLYCHKIWSKKHVHRRAENIYEELKYYYNNGVKNFAFIDDCFNLDRKNSSRLFQQIIKDKLNLQLFFPNGLRGDLMTPDYIDQMVEAGTRGINLSLETGSPRLQKLLKKHLDLDRFRNVMEYIAGNHPEVMLEVASMHGFPTETEEEAMMTLNFIKSIKWLHFPYIHILKIFPNTEMEEFALAHGISKRDILASRDRAFHELPDTLPFPKSFTRQYQADFMNTYFLNKDRLRHVLPVQMNILSERALVQKYNAYLPADINSVRDIIEFAGLEGLPVPEGYADRVEDVPAIFEHSTPVQTETVSSETKKILFLDLSQHFSSHKMLYNVAEQPLGEIYLLTYLKERYGEKIDGKIYKAGNDFDDYDLLKVLVDKYQPDLIGIRTLTFFKEFFHETVARLRQWGVTIPIITGGPYASSDYDTILKDGGVDLAVLGEGEYTLAQLFDEMDKNGFRIPGTDALKDIQGIAFRDEEVKEQLARQVLVIDQIAWPNGDDDDAAENQDYRRDRQQGNRPAYVMYTSGTTGRPKGVMVEHRQVNNCIAWMQDKFRLTATDEVLQRTNLTFDPSVWEIFWPLQQGGRVRAITSFQGKDAEYLLRLMEKGSGVTMMYTPATLMNAMVSVLERKEEKPELTMPWLIIGAEPIGMEEVKKFYAHYRGRIVNTYGPTECTINNTYYDLHPDDRRTVVPIGKPVHNNTIYIFLPDMHLAPVNIPGEICIAGLSVARGYINNVTKTADSFIDNPYGDGKCYKTGDIGRWLADGNIEILGRKDEQVKIRGYRIELDEIKTALTKHPELTNSVVVVRDAEDDKDEVNICQKCGITSEYPGIAIKGDQCNVCSEINNYKQTIDRYWGNLEELEQLIRKENEGQQTQYDCLVLYAGGRGAAHALYRLKDMGLRVLTATYDNGYFSKRDMDNIRRITTQLGFQHRVLTHPKSTDILRESMKTAHTVCRGCFHASSALAAQYAYQNGIKVVVGGTLSRGQIIENKLIMFLQQRISDQKQLEKEIAAMQHDIMEVDKNIFDYIDIEEVRSGEVKEKVKIIDFYRYIDISNSEMIEYLNNRDPYWKTRKNYAIYSTNCPIKQLGDYQHLISRAYHFYGGATSWEQRLGHLTVENRREDLQCNITQKALEQFYNRIDYEPGENEKKEKNKTGKYLCAYYESLRELEVAEFRETLSKDLPAYMIPSYFMRLPKIPLHPSGKIDKRSLPRPDGKRKQSANYVAPGSDLEKQIALIWQEVLEIEKAGIQDNFFDQGGTSMHIIQVGSRLRTIMKREIPLVTLFNHTTIQELAQHLEGEQKHKEKQKALQEKELKKSRGTMKKTISKLRGRRMN